MKLPFWFILTYDSDTAKCWFYPMSLSSVEKNRVLSCIRIGVKRIVQRTNQLILLKQLHETRICPPELSFLEHTLIPSTNPKEGLKSGFTVNEFACPRKAKLKFPLHPRVPPSKVIGPLTASAFNPFFVSNRKGLFVLREESGKVFYMELTDSVSKIRRKQEGKSSFSLTPSSLSRSYSIPDLASSSSMESLHKALSKETLHLILNVYGPDEAGPEITVHFYEVLKSRLASITLASLSGLLER